MVQGGDPTGTGEGGESAWGKPFRDEFDSRLLHDKRGILSMANSGQNTNGSQFFITFQIAKHLDFKHCVFGRIVGGNNTLERIEAIGADKKEKPLQEIKLLKAIVFTNPIEEADVLLKEEIQLAKRNRIEATVPTPLPKASSSASIPAITNITDSSDSKELKSSISISVQDKDTQDIPLPAPRKRKADTTVTAASQMGGSNIGQSNVMHREEKKSNAKLSKDELVELFLRSQGADVLEPAKKSKNSSYSNFSSW